MTIYKPGSRWKSVVCSAEFVVVRPPAVEGEILCGGSAVISHDSSNDAPGELRGEGLPVTVGKRYTDAASGLEILGTKTGRGALTFNGVELALKDAKPLPASD